MATAPVLDQSQSLPAWKLLARVGRATWAITLDPDALGVAAEGRTDPDLRRVMESVRRKALSLRMFGGGAIDLCAADIGDPPEVLRDDEGRELAFRPWYEIVSVIANEAG
jgi:hypothetical protein